MGFNFTIRVMMFWDQLQNKWINIDLCAGVVWYKVISHGSYKLCVECGKELPCLVLQQGVCQYAYICSCVFEINCTFVSRNAMWANRFMNLEIRHLAPRTCTLGPAQFCMSTVVMLMSVMTSALLKLRNWFFSFGAPNIANNISILIVLMSSLQWCTLFC
jgi:hypothetical protein